MNTGRLVKFVLAGAILAASGGAFAQSAEPTVDSIVNSLKSSRNSATTEDTRALRPGAASMATTAPAAEPEPEPAATAAAAPAPAAAARPKPKPKPKPRSTRTHAGNVAANADRASIDMRVNFDFNSDRISPDSDGLMAKLAEALASPQLEDRKFEIVGHTDAVGSAAYNQALSERRAKAVVAYLVQHGVAADRLSVVGRGESQLLDPRNPDSAENRRVEIIATGR